MACDQVIATAPVNDLKSFFQDLRHGRVHRPARIKNLQQPADMLVYMNARRKGERIDPQKRREKRICAEGGNVLPPSKHLLVLAFCRFDYHKFYFFPVQAVQQPIAEIGFSHAGCACDKDMA